MIRQACEKHYLAGVNPQVKFTKSNEGGFAHTSFSLFDHAEAQSYYYRAAHLWIIANIDPQGLYSRKRKFPGLEEALNRPFLTAADLVLGDIVKCTKIRDISNQPRESVIDCLDQREEDGILEGVCKEQDGYFGEHGSFYTFEIENVWRDNFWQPVCKRQCDIDLMKLVRGH